jgi:hypothetical protein
MQARPWAPVVLGCFVAATGCSRDEPAATRRPVTLPTTPAQTTQAVAPAPHAPRHDPKVGTRLPNFVLRDQKGKKRSLEEFLGHGKVVLVFFRSATW